MSTVRIYFFQNPPVELYQKIFITTYEPLRTAFWTLIVKRLLYSSFWWYYSSEFWVSKGTGHFGWHQQPDFCDVDKCQLVGTRWFLTGTSVVSAACLAGAVKFCAAKGEDGPLGINDAARHLQHTRSTWLFWHVVPFLFPWWSRWTN